MLPAVAAYVVFSSSIVNLLQCRLTNNRLLTGLILLIAISLAPFFYKKIKSSRKAS